MQVSDWLIQSFKSLGVPHIFLVPGGEIDPLVVSIGKDENPQPILACHEEGAGFMADGFARISENLGICMTIGAPGAGNALPAALAAASDRSSVLFLTGGSPIKWMGRANFQESDEAGTADTQFFAPTVRFSEAITQESMLSKVFDTAFKYMRTEFPGPVHISLPTDIQTAECTQTSPLKIPPKEHAERSAAPGLESYLFKKNSKYNNPGFQGILSSRIREDL